MVNLSFVGDIFPSDELFTCGFGVKSMTNENRARLWINNVCNVVGKADYIVGNLESPLVEDSQAVGDTFYGNPLFAEVLKDSGINIINIANNHILEHGVGGFDKTLDTIQERGLFVIGRQKDGASEILKICKDDTTICIAGFCDERVCSITNPGCYASLNEGGVFSTFERMKALSPDIIIMVFHWGNEYIHFPSLEQRKLAYKLIDEGANLIVGHHPHVIQPYEHYKNGHIIYSLGNFCFDDVQSEHFGQGMLARINIQGKDIHDVSFSGVLVQDMAYGSDSLVKPMDKDAFKEYFSQVNSRYNKLKEMDDERYQKIYQTTLRREHAKERVYMRMNIVKKVMDLRHRHKTKLLSNIKNYIFK